MADPVRPVQMGRVGSEVRRRRKTLATQLASFDARDGQRRGAPQVTRTAMGSTTHDGDDGSRSGCVRFHDRTSFYLPFGT